MGFSLPPTIFRFFDEGSSNDLIVNRSSIISNMTLGDQTTYLPKSELAPEKA
ncbi:hypothetical protein J1N35_024315 [Gossypium stocksii]|uniref:Uncharacterized protein n=1 Tax=Gossypium stocksii TaxID=47602 RepID=A0A9D3VL79_9ROSI|nr:hypothetical protein J1N35_024315 [Gossypium stocksii]